MLLRIASDTPARNTPPLLPRMRLAGGIRENRLAMVFRRAITLARTHMSSGFLLSGIYPTNDSAFFKLALNIALIAFRIVGFGCV